VIPVEERRAPALLPWTRWARRPRDRPHENRRPPRSRGGRASTIGCGGALCSDDNSFGPARIPRPGPGL